MRAFAPGLAERLEELGELAGQARGWSEGQALIAAGQPGE